MTKPNNDPTQLVVGTRVSNLLDKTVWAIFKVEGDRIYLNGTRNSTVTTDFNFTRFRKDWFIVSQPEKVSVSGVTTSVDVPEGYEIKPIKKAPKDEHLERQIETAKSRLGQEGIPSYFLNTSDLFAQIANLPNAQLSTWAYVSAMEIAYTIRDLPKGTPDRAILHILRGLTKIEFANPSWMSEAESLIDQTVKDHNQKYMAMVFTPVKAQEAGE